MPVYLLHFERPYKHARHYVGMTVNLDRRLEQHRTGDGYQQNRLMQMVHEHGIPFQLARTWEGGRVREVQIHRRGGKAKFCAVCRAAARREGRA